MKQEINKSSIQTNAEILADYLFSLKSSLSENTISQYHQFLDYFLQAINKHTCDIQKDDIFSFLLNYGVNKKSRTIHHRVSLLTSYFKFCFNEDIISEIPITRRMKPRKTPHGDVRILSADERAIINKKAEFLKLRDRIMYDFANDSGVRRSEVVNLNVNDIDLNNGIVSICGKGNKHRVIPLSSKMIFELQSYIPSLKSDSIFVNRYGNKISSKHFWRVTKSLQNDCNLTSSFYPHLIRHMKLTELVKEKGIIEAQEQAGHANLTTTLQYLHPGIEDIRPFYDKGCPR